MFTAGGVVQAREKLMSVVPEQQTLIIEGKLSPQWIDKVALVSLRICCLPPSIRT